MDPQVRECRLQCVSLSRASEAVVGNVALCLALFPEINLGFTQQKVTREFQDLTQDSAPRYGYQTVSPPSSGDTEASLSTGCRATAPAALGVRQLSSMNLGQRGRGNFSCQMLNGVPSILSNPPSPAVPILHLDRSDTVVLEPVPQCQFTAKQNLLTSVLEFQCWSLCTLVAHISFFEHSSFCIYQYAKFFHSLTQSCGLYELVTWSCWGIVICVVCAMRRSRNSFHCAFLWHRTESNVYFWCVQWDTALQVKRGLCSANLTSGPDKQ